jgi:hypothetical protein
MLSDDEWLSFTYDLNQAYGYLYIIHEMSDKQSDEIPELFDALEIIDKFCGQIDDLERDESECDDDD